MYKTCQISITGPDDIISIEHDLLAAPDLPVDKWHAIMDQFNLSRAEITWLANSARYARALIDKLEEHNNTNSGQNNESSEATSTTL